jgi:DNA replication protein DnaC
MVMQTLREIFYSGLEPNDDNIIRAVDINWNQHSSGVLNIAKSIEPDFLIDETNKDVLKQLLLYFTGSDEFDGSLKKGIMLIGGVGTGKSLLFRIFKEYTSQIIRINSFQYHTSQEIIDNVNVKGVEYMDVFNHNYDNPITCYIDDIASRNEVIKYYGTEVNVMEQLLSIRYNVFSRYRKLTHVTSNKYPSDFKDLYDNRIVDRMKEMFNIIELTGKSFRK